MIIGLFLIIFGVLWVLENAGAISVAIANFIWPVILIAIGGQILWDYWRKGKNCCSKETQEKKNK